VQSAQSAKVFNLVGTATIKNQSELETVLPLNSWAPATIKNQSELETVLPLNSWAPATIKKSERVGNNASTQLVGSCHNKKIERVGNSASTQLVGSCHDKKSERVGNSAFTQLVGFCHDKKSERVGNNASTQLVGFCHDNKSEQVTFDKQEKDAVLLYYLWSKDTQHHYDEEPLQKQCCTDSGIQSNIIFTSEKTNSCQQSTHSANSEGGRLALLLLSGRKSVGIQPTSLHLKNKSRQSPSFVDDVSIDSWQCQMEIDTVKSKKT